MSSRHSVRRAALDFMAESSDLDDVTITLVWPGDRLDAEAIYLLPSRGILDVPVSRGQPTTPNPLIYEDNFIVPLELWAGKAGQTEDEADARIDELVGIVIARIAADPTLGLGFPNDIGLFHALAGEYEGPGPVQGANGASAVARLTLNCRTRSI